MIDQKFHRAQDGDSSGPGDDGKISWDVLSTDAPSFNPLDMFVPPPSWRGTVTFARPYSDDGNATSTSTVRPLQTSVTPAVVMGAPPNGSTMDDEIAYVGGVTNAGSVAAVSGQTWNGDGQGDATSSDTIATYNPTTSTLAKWGDQTIGTGGGTQYYYFDTASNWSAGEEALLAGGLALWSAVSNINFAETTVRGAASLDFVRGNTGGEYETGSTAPGEAIGATVLGGSQGTNVSINITTNAPDSGFGPISFSSDTYPIDALVHEEGHYLGFYHAGPYNGNVNAVTQQFSPYDSRLYSIMSYIDPQATAKYASPIAGTSWNNNDPTTPMMLDILAAQRIYGAPTSGLLAGNQTFGFNVKNLNALIQPFFDFTINTAPIVTLFDTGAGNTLDLSGYSTPETVDLLPGTFSSFDGLVNNLGIAFNTAIDNFIGGSGGHDTVIANTDSDVFTFSGAGNTVDLAGSPSDYSSVNVTATETIYTQTATGKTYTAYDAQTFQFIAACYARGTRIATPTGETPIEALSIGDLVLTASGEARPVRWLGWRAVDIARQPDPSMLWPIVVEADAFAPGVPARDLVLSPEHKIADQGVLIPIYLLRNDCTIVQRRCDAIEYWHLELDAHDVILADGMPAETYLDTGNRNAFVNGGAFMTLHPDFRTHGNADTCLPLVLDGPSLTAVKTALLDRAKTFGHALTEEDDRHIVADGQRIEPIHLAETIAAFLLPPGCADISLRSRVFVPAHVSADRADGRSLGLYLERMQLDGRDVALEDDAVCAAGWHGYEEHEGRRGRRWTTGATPLPANTRLVVLDFAGRGQYWVKPQSNVVALFG